VSLLCGCFGLYLATLGLFAFGISITPWHGLAFLASACLASFFALDGGVIGRLKKTGSILLLQLFLCGAFTGAASRLDELTVDGMRARTETVMNLMAGWNPIKDPEFSQRAELQEIHPFLRGGHNHQPSVGAILAGYLACLTDEINAGKAITPILGVAVFGIAFGGLTALAIPVGWAVALAALAAMNPVILYQSSSYYIDGHVAALFTGALFAGVRLLASPTEMVSKGVFFISLCSLAAAKNSGIFYGGILFGLMGLVWFLKSQKKYLAVLLICLVSLFMAIAVLFFRTQGGFASLTQEYLHVGSNFEEGGHGYRQLAPGLAHGDRPSRGMVFFRSHFAPTAALAEEHVSIKFLFWFNRRELAVFEDLTPQPYVGGFGPLYGAFFILSALSLTLIRNRPPLCSWLPLVASFGSIYFSQIWWARWTPQAWLIPLGFLLPVLCSLEGPCPRRRWILPFLAIFTGLLNSILILAFYTTGCIKSQLTLESQLSFLKTLPQPLQVFMPDYPANRIFFIRENLDFIYADRLPPLPRLKLHRTTTEVALPPGIDLPNLLDPAVLKNWKKRKLIELNQISNRS
jgi:hypothetical protein